MSVKELQFPEWQTPIQELTLECDIEKLTKKVHIVENLLSERLQQLDRGGDGHIERAAISEALGGMRGIQRDKLGYPDWQGDRELPVDF